MTVADDLCGMNKLELWASGSDLRVVSAEWVDDSWLVSVVASDDQRCSDCAEHSKLRHSRHERQLQDLPVQGLQVALKLCLGRIRLRSPSLLVEVLDGAAARRLRVMTVLKGVWG